jgi:hypothetical protein
MRKNFFFVFFVEKDEKLQKRKENEAVDVIDKKKQNICSLYTESERDRRNVVAATRFPFAY